jgi:hypothetical protein
VRKGAALLYGFQFFGASTFWVIAQVQNHIHRGGPARQSRNRNSNISHKDAKAAKIRK